MSPGVLLGESTVSSRSIELRCERTDDEDALGVRKADQFVDEGLRAMSRPPMEAGSTGELDKLAASPRVEDDGTRVSPMFIEEDERTIPGENQFLGRAKSERERA